VPRRGAHMSSTWPALTPDWRRLRVSAVGLGLVLLAAAYCWPAAVIDVTSRVGSRDREADCTRANGGEGCRGVDGAQLTLLYGVWGKLFSPAGGIKARHNWQRCSGAQPA
jgi:hypothetical protein